VLAYCFSAVISQLEFGVIANQEAKILNIANYILSSGKCSAWSGKYAVICLQFVLHSKSENQWNNEPQTDAVLSNLLLQVCVVQKDAIQK
jgi:hypothetical protein